MKKMNFVVGAVITWIGVEKLTAETPNGIGWFFLVMGIITILSAFFSFTGSGSGWAGLGSGWGGGSSGDDCGGGGD